MVETAEKPVPFYCYLCEKSHSPLKKGFKCPKCGVTYCKSSIGEMRDSNYSRCPQCFSASFDEFISFNVKETVFTPPEKPKPELVKRIEEGYVKMGMKLEKETRPASELAIITEPQRFKLERTKLEQMGIESEKGHTEDKLFEAVSRSIESGARSFLITNDRSEELANTIIEIVRELNPPDVKSETVTVSSLVYYFDCGNLFGFDELKKLNHSIDNDYYMILYLENAHFMTANIQQALRRLMEKTTTATFIISTNYVHKITLPIQSRCIRFDALTGGWIQRSGRGTKPEIPDIIVEDKSDKVFVGTKGGGYGEVSKQSLKEYLDKHPDEAKDITNLNELGFADRMLNYWKTWHSPKERNWIGTAVKIMFGIMFGLIFFFIVWFFINASKNIFDGVW